MAKIIKPSKDFYIDNCPVTPITSTEDKAYPELFFIELHPETRVDYEIEPKVETVPFYLTGTIR